MPYDVFISYSRKDSSEVNSLIDRLRREIPEIKIWYDIEGIESADAFRRKIITAIDESNLVLFACSDHSLESEYCEKEIMYAKNVDKKVIPYILPGMKLKGWLLFEYGNLNCINASKPDEVSRLIQDLKRWFGNKDESGKKKDESNSLDPSPESDQESKAFKLEVKTGPTSKTVSDKGFINGHKYVDLGLPSGLKWATCNIGATKPEEYGEYFAWGEVQSKSSYSERNSETYDKSRKWLKRNGYIEDNGNLSLSHDAACQNWGSSWRMPNKKDLEELINNTTTEWTTRNGVVGRLVKSKKNGKSIFFPAAGWPDVSSLIGVGEMCLYWSSSLYEGSSDSAHDLSSFSDSFYSALGRRYDGHSIRPVSE